jgi:hypothetical protein
MRNVSLRTYSKSWSLALLATLIWSIGIISSQAQTPTANPTTTESPNRPQTRQFQQVAERFITLLGKGDYTKARGLLAPSLQSQWSAEKIQQLWEQDLIKRTGAFQNIIKSKNINAINAELVTLDVKFANSQEDIIVTLNPNRQIIGLDLPETRTVEEISREFVNALVTGDYAKARGYLHPLLKTEEFPQKVQQQWEEMLKTTGSFKRQVGYNVRKGSGNDGVDVVLVTLQFEKITEDLFLVFDDNKQIVNVDFPETN